MRCPTGAGFVGQKKCNFSVALRNVADESTRSVLEHSQLSHMLAPSPFLPVLTQPRAARAAAVEFRVVEAPMKAVFKAGPSDTLPQVATFLGTESGAQG